MKHKAISIQSKPEVDMAKLDELAAAEEAKAVAIAAKLDDEPDDDEKEEELPENKPPVEPVVEPVVTPEPEVVDYKKKYTESQKEALILKKKLEMEEEARNKKVEVTPDYMKTLYPEWEDMTANEQLALQKAEELKQEVQELKNNANKFNNDREWNEKVETFITDELPDLFPKIVGHEEDFKRFATRPTRKGLPLDDLGKIFLFENPPVDAKRNLFHAPGSAGAPPADEGMSAEDVRTLRINKPLEYMRLVRAGKIKLKI
jgi:chromosome segregation ATPase